MMAKSPQRRFSLQWADFDIEPVDGVVDGPTLDDVRAITRHLAQATEGFVILSLEDERYIQTTFSEPGDGEAGFQLELRDGSAERHFELDEDFVDIATVVESFEAYFADPAGVAERAGWRLMKL
jgi:hypothetical protein